VVGADNRYRVRRIENTLTDGKGNGASRVEISVTAKAKK